MDGVAPIKSIKYSNNIIQQYIFLPSFWEIEESIPPKKSTNVFVMSLRIVDVIVTEIIALSLI